MFEDSRLILFQGSLSTYAMSRKYLTLLLVFLSAITPQCLGAKTLEGDGYGTDLKKAQKSALATLASNIYVNVESKSSTYQDTTGVNKFSFEATVTTNIPMFGVRYKCTKKRNEHFCTAVLDTNSSNPLYKREIKRLVDDINDNYSIIVAVEQSAKLDILYSLLSTLRQYEKLVVVASLLADRNINIDKPNITTQQVISKITEQQSAVRSLNVAARLLNQQIDEKNIFIKPITLMNSREITPFSSALNEEVKSLLKTVKTKERATFLLTGNYIESNSGIKVSYDLSDKDGNTLKSFVVNLLPDSYVDFRTTPLAPDFDQLLHSGYAVSSDFKAALATNKGIRGLLFKEWEKIELLTKVNQPGYFYIVGYTKKAKLEQSYLVDLNDAPGDRRFITYVNADEVNKWISLGEFVVERPFGIESLQLVASTHDLLGYLPSYKYSFESGYYVISDDIEEGLKQTRGIKKVKKTGSSKSEAVLLFTTESN